MAPSEVKLHPSCVSLGPELLPESQQETIHSIVMDACSRKNLAWRLVKHVFTEDELKGHNCYGRRNKPALDQAKLSRVQSLCYAYYPMPDDVVNDLEHMRITWRECCIAIDKGIRNTYEYGHLGQIT